MRSIMQIPDGRCYFCEILGDYSEKPVEEHHCIFGTSGRRLSTKFGLTVWLCPHHHRTSKLSVHQNHELAAYLQDKAQRCFESYFPDKNFLLEFGKNYKLTSEERCNALKILRGGMSMKMTAEEILAMYNKDRSRENMQKIADLNGCTMHDVGKFLKAAADTPKKRGRGRPKKPSSDKTKSNKKTDTRNKVEALPEEKRSQKYLIPEIVESLTREKIDEYRRKADFFREKAAEEELKADELQDFLNGGFCDGAKDGIHREI